MSPEKILILVFKKTTGTGFNYNIPFPDNAVEGVDVKALAQVMITNNIFEFQDGSKLATLEDAYLKETSKNPISIA